MFNLIVIPSRYNLPLLYQKILIYFLRTVTGFNHAMNEYISTRVEYFLANTVYKKAKREKKLYIRE